VTVKTRYRVVAYELDAGAQTLPAPACNRWRVAMALATSAVRIAATEDQPTADLIPALEGIGMPTDKAVAALVSHAARLRRNLSDKDVDPVRVDRRSVTFSNLAGVVRLGPGIEIDLAPKFLSHQEPDWREDFIAIASITGEGRILAGENVTAEVRHVHDLASLLGHVFSEEFSANRRTPLRVYQRRRWRDHGLDGELDFDELHVQDPEGLPQRAILRDSMNPFNALLARATELLLMDVRHPQVRARLTAMRSALGAQRQPLAHLPPIPSRHRRWAPLLDLAQHVVEGFEISLRAGDRGAPGFVIRSWQAWERLLYLALRNSSTLEVVEFKPKYTWGARGSTPIKVTPDLSYAVGILDAKYKGKAEDVQGLVNQSDLMEAAAFMAASKQDRISLLYPRTAASGPRWELGTGRIFDRAELTGGKTVLGVEIEVRGYGARGGYRSFAERLSAAVAALVEGPLDLLVPGRAV
jgi:5-methylcytosine-specific restriction enzyme subunit McrC